MIALVTLRYGAAVLAGGLAFSAGAQQKSVVPDAQIEANVLRALAGAPELSTQNIQTATVYGVVTLSGSANDEVSRSKAENIVARVDGVKKVIDEMTLGTSTSMQQAPYSRNPASQSDSTNPATQSQGQNAQAEQTSQEESSSEAATASQQNERPDPGFGSPPAPGAQNRQSPAAENGQNSRRAANPYPAQGPSRFPQQNGQPPQNREQYPTTTHGQYPPSANGNYPPRRPMYRAPYPQGGQQGGQQAGRQVVVPPGSLIRVRINQGLNTQDAQPGAVFDVTVLNDVVADGAVAIPRGASAQGTVIDVKSSGALKGRGELSLQLTMLTLGGQRYALSSDVWSRTGADKTVRTVDSALGLGALGAVLGAAAGGGAGAAIGAGVGGAAGVASSVAYGGGNVMVSPEAVLVFHIDQPVTVATVSEQEMGRLSYAAGPNPDRYPVARRRRYPQTYPGPYGYPYGPYYGRY